jgi:hypothetical protein
MHAENETDEATKKSDNFCPIYFHPRKIEEGGWKYAFRLVGAHFHLEGRGAGLVVHGVGLD